MTSKRPTIAIACGGTGGHLFPGLAVASVLQQWDCEVVLMVSKKEVDQEAIKSAAPFQVLTMPAVALQGRNLQSFLSRSWESYRACKKMFRTLRPWAVLAMGGFTSAPPVLAGKATGAAAFIHESNSIPGRANRWLSPWVDAAFVGFPTAGRRLYCQTTFFVGTPVRSQFKPCDPAPCRLALGLAPNKPVLLVMGGSQGAAAINRLLCQALPLLKESAPDLQFLHLTGAEDLRRVQETYAQHSCRAVVRPFLTEMDLALGAATLAINRAGASSLAEIAAVQLPAIVIPYPNATDDHQFFNARAFADTGAVRLLRQGEATPELLVRETAALLQDQGVRAAMQRALRQWYFPQAASQIAQRIFEHLRLAIPQPPAAEEEEGGFALPARPSPLRGKFQLAPAQPG